MNSNRLFSALWSFIFLLAACSKGSAPDPAPPAGGGTGGTTNPTPIVVKTMGVNVATLLMDSANRIVYLNITNGFGNIIKFQPGNTLQLELVNANTEPRTEIDRDVSRVYYANVKKGAVGSSLNVTPADSATYLFWKVKGFDARVGFHEVNIIMCDDAASGSGIIALGYNSSTASAPGASLLTSQALRNLFNTKLDCIQLVVGGTPYY